MTVGAYSTRLARSPDRPGSPAQQAQALRQPRTERKIRIWCYTVGVSDQSAGPTAILSTQFAKPPVAPGDQGRHPPARMKEEARGIQSQTTRDRHDCITLKEPT
jgi:hypothetical protein